MSWGKSDRSPGPGGQSAISPSLRRRSTHAGASWSRNGQPVAGTTASAGEGHEDGEVEGEGAAWTVGEAARAGSTSAYAWGDEATVDGALMANTWQGRFPYRNDGALGWTGTRQGPEQFFDNDWCKRMFEAVKTSPLNHAICTLMVATLARS